MSLIDRYLMRAILSGTALVLLVLVSLSGFINFVGQLDEVGSGDYQLPQALVFVLLQAAGHAYDMFPVAVLIGALWGLGNLASHSELVVMRAAGVSVWRLAFSVMLSGLLLCLLAGALGELIAPPAEQFARRFRTLSMHRDLTLAGGENAWIKESGLIVNIERPSMGGRLGGVYIFSFDGTRSLASIARAASAGFGAGGQWYLYDFRETRFEPHGVEAERVPRLARPTELSPEIVNLSVVDPDSLDSRGLHEYVRYLERNGLDAYAYSVALWSRIANTVSVLLMTALALPFVFGPLRTAGAGGRLMVGILIGIAYYLGSRTLASSGAVFDIDPLLIGWLPAIALAVVVVLGLSRVR